MSVTIHTPNTHALEEPLVKAWRDVPVSVAVDLVPNSQIDPVVKAHAVHDRPIQMAGPALTVSCTPPDFGAVVRALDEVCAGRVVIIDASAQTSHAVIGEILGGHLRAKGCAGLVVNGAVRDISDLGNWDDFPVFALSINPLGPTSANDGSINTPVKVGGVVIRPGDLVLGDRDGLAVLTPEQAQDRLHDAQVKLALEAEWIEGLASGKSAKEVFGL